MKNNNSYISKNISNWLFGSIGLLLFLPIVIFPPNFQPSDWSRTMLFRIVLTILVSYIFYRFFYKKNLSLTLPKWDKLTYAPLLILGAFFVNLIIATIFSEDILFSIFGSPARSGGVLNLLFFFILSIILVIFISKSQWEKFFHLLFASGLIASLFAIVQYFNILKNVFISFESGSTPSFLGNSTILAIFILFLVFWSFLYFIKKQNRREKIIYGGLFVLFTFTIFITGSRAAYLGLLIGFMYFFLLYPYRQKYKILKITAISILLVAIIIVTIFNFFPQLGDKNNILKTVSTRLSINKVIKDVFGTRLSAWTITMQAIKDKPLLGFGPENFYIGFEKHYNPIPFNIPKLLWNRPHNILLDVTVNSGIFSLLLYIFFWIVLFWKLQKVKKPTLQDSEQTDITLKAHTLQAMFIGYLIIIFFSFDSFSTYLISFFFIGYSFYLIFFQSEKLVILPPQRNFLQKKPVFFIYLTMAILFLWFWNIKPLYLNEKIIFAQNLTVEKIYCKDSLNFVNNIKWENSGIIKPYAILIYSDIVRKCAFVEPEKEIEYSKKATSLLKLATDGQPKFSQGWLFRGSFTNVLAAREENIDEKNKLLTKAKSYLDKALELSPGRQESFVEIEKNYLIAKDYESIKKTAKDCIAIDPRFGECYWYLALAQVFLGEQKDAKNNVDLAIKSGYQNPPYKQLAIAYMSQENWKEALLAYEKAIIPSDASMAVGHYATLTFLYDKNRQYTDAAKTAIEVFKLQPKNRETFQFIKLLLAKNPNDPILNSSIAFIYKEPGPDQDIVKSKAIYLNLIQGYPEELEYRWQLAHAYYNQKEYDKAYQEIVTLVSRGFNKISEMNDFLKTFPKQYLDQYLKIRPKL